MSYHPDDTIAAIATAPGGAARGLVRVSGLDAVAIASSCFDTDGGPTLDSLRQPMALSGQAKIALNESAPQPVPCELLVWPTNRSYTREPVAEFHTLGSPPLLAALLGRICRAGARIAEPGEFTLRGFLAGRLDLTQAEAVLGVIDARHAADFHVALKQLAGGLARPLDDLRDNLLQLLAELEAGLDFVDEDIEFISRAELQRRLVAGERLLADVAEQMASRMATTSVHQAALVGPPNAGKSSLFNALVSRYGKTGGSPQRRSQPAIVSPARGTTRDYLSVTLDIDGLRCELIDTAGIDPEEAIAHIDAASQMAATEQRERASVRVWCIEAPNAAPQLDLRSVHGGPPNLVDRDIIVLTKADLVERRNPLPNVDRLAAPVVITSSRTGEGLAELAAMLHSRLNSEAAAGSGQVVTATADRCQESIRAATSAIGRARGLVEVGGGEELVAVEVRAALDELGKVVGAVYTDDLLDRIFKTFCIGK